MKKLAYAVAIIAFAGSASAQHYVSGYTRSNGTYVAPHYSSNSNSTVQDNYSYRGNSDPYSGSTGSDTYQHDTTSSYYEGPDSRGRSGHSSYNSNYR